jgi:hypothetical protein
MEYTVGQQIAVIRILNWEDLRRIGNLMRRWLFRGQENKEWLLKSSLERAFESRDIQYRTDPIEEMILNEFKSLAHLFTNSLPKDDDTIAWLNLIRHHGGPTRLLDFTESFYVAAYFALESAVEECAIWAFNRVDYIANIEIIINSLCDQYKIDPMLSVSKKLDEILMKSIRGDIHLNQILTMSPSKRNERQFMQQGLAMIPLNLRDGFMGALLGSFDPPGIMPNEGSFRKIGFDEIEKIIKSSMLIKIIIAKDAFLDARTDLAQMNINAATLFRGLDGLGKKVQDVLNSVEHYISKR